MQTVKGSHTQVISPVLILHFPRDAVPCRAFMRVAFGVSKLSPLSASLFHLSPSEWAPPDSPVGFQSRFFSRQSVAITEPESSAKTGRC